MAEFDNDYFRQSAGLPGLSQGFQGGAGIQGPQKGVLGIIEYLARPSYALSEAAQAFGTGEGISGAWEGIGRGIEGKRKFGLPGEAIFPGSREDPDWTIEDVGRLGIDFLADPLLFAGGVHKGAKLLGPPIARQGAKLVNKFGLELTPGIKQVLKWKPELEVALKGNPKKKAMMLAEDLDALELTPDQALKRVLQLKDVEAGPTKHLLDRIDSLPGKLGDKLVDLPEDVIDIMRAGVRSIDANFRPNEMSLFQRGIQEMATRWAPAGAVLKHFGGRSGKVMARKYTDAMASTRLREGGIMDELEQVFRKTTEKHRIAAVQHYEGTKLSSDPAVLAKAEQLKKLIKRHWDDLNDIDYDPRTGKQMAPGDAHRDPFGNTVSVWNSQTKEATPLIDNFVENYFPRRLQEKWFGNWRGLEKHLAESGMNELEIDRFIRRMQWKPKKVGQIEMARLQKDPNWTYEMDPLKALPRYFRDSIMRQELGKQFGFGHEILETLAGDLKKFGLRKDWVDDLSGAVSANQKRYGEALAQMSGALNSVQAVTKLGFATSVANFSQSPLNQVIRNGYGNYIKSFWKAGIPVPMSPYIVGGSAKGVRRLGLAAYNRGMQEQIRHLIGGGEGFFQRNGTRYMKWIGFNYTERIGRMVGAVGGKLEVEDMIKQWNVHRKAGDTGKMKNVVSELMRKYEIDGAMLEKAAVYGEDGLPLIEKTDLYEELVERAALKSSDAIMHAFDVLDLPLGWRDPLWRSVLQFKSFGYKQLEFMGKEVVQPALQYYASGGTKGTIAPMLRSAAMYPPMAFTVEVARDAVKNMPRKLIWGEWDLEDPFWEDPHIGLRLWNDMLYVGSLGLMGDAIQQAERGRFASWALGPTISEGVRLGEEVVQGRFDAGKAATRMVPAALSVNRARDIMNQAKNRDDLPFEWMLP